MIKFNDYIKLRENTPPQNQQQQQQQTQQQTQQNIQQLDQNNTQSMASTFDQEFKKNPQAALQWLNSLYKQHYYALQRKNQAQQPQQQQSQPQQQQPQQ